MKLIVQLFINTVAVLVAAYILPGIEVADTFTAFLVGIVIGVLNTFIKPLLVLLTLPITLLTFGLFALIINGLLVIVTSYLVPGFIVGSLIDALLFSIILSITSSFLWMLAK
ncbi:phage holin family protein [candidate division WWE3 bacterium]|uniref:Phage holin family protein n=1 Tax=candidate division WWE3 bacterium TaxID=2053526 RepID=A0A7X9DLE1_UNCKA|nr:phage holin family protein [candidate division WWE3 bacterium]